MMIMMRMMKMIIMMNNKQKNNNIKHKSMMLNKIRTLLKHKHLSHILFKSSKIITLKTIQIERIYSNKILQLAIIQTQDRLLNLSSTRINNRSIPNKIMIIQTSITGKFNQEFHQIIIIKINHQYSSQTRNMIKTNRKGNKASKTCYI